MRDHLIWSLLAGLATGGFGATSLIHLVSPLGRPPRWGKRGQGRPMSRRSILWTGGTFFIFGITIIAATLCGAWVERILLPLVFVVTLVAVFVSWLHDLDNERDA
jgi:hypothetical protein